ncbi:hypothetical protein [Sphingobium sp. KCTC 72723]|uniref:hypothetical protein n=1 Tax=Sphingobium sp. KCTC 72723 TaxID=2733867 RepID=UPI00165E8E61|nr:hypothetical protein [Sphingobium sp. KCTC 72723]
MVGIDRLRGVNPDIPADFDPEVAFAALGSILASMRASYGFTWLGIHVHRDGHFQAEGTWGDAEIATADGDDANAALKGLVAIKSSIAA